MGLFHFSTAGKCIEFKISSSNWRCFRLHVGAISGMIWKQSEPKYVSNTVSYIIVDNYLP